MSRLHLPAPLRSTGVTGFIATMGALTPAWRRGPQASVLLAEAVPWDPFSFLRHAGLLASRVLSLQRLPSPITPLPPMTALSPNPLASWDSRSHGYRLRHWAAGSPVSVAESSLLSYGRLCSPSVALHPASRRRSYGWLQAGVGLPEEDLHLPEQNALASAQPPALAVGCTHPAAQRILRADFYQSPAGLGVFEVGPPQGTVRNPER